MAFGNGNLCAVFGCVGRENTAVEGMGGLFFGAILSFVVCACVFVLECDGMVDVGPRIFKISSFVDWDGGCVAIFLYQIGVDGRHGGFDGSVLIRVFDSHIASALFFIFRFWSGVARGAIFDSILAVLGFWNGVDGFVWRLVLFPRGCFRWDARRGLDFRQCFFIGGDFPIDAGGGFATLECG